jgi:lipopolysaccharide export system protein LptA
MKISPIPALESIQKNLQRAYEKHTVVYIGNVGLIGDDLLILADAVNMALDKAYDESKWGQSVTEEKKAQNRAWLEKIKMDIILVPNHSQFDPSKLKVPSTSQFIPKA